MTHHDGTLDSAGSRPPRASTALLRLQADERLVAHVRRGNQAAFEVLVSRYRVRLLAFCRHMLGSNAGRDAEDVLQEVFTSAYRAMLGDTRPINVRPWLYRIARNRCLNHLRREPMVSVEGMELTVVDERIGTAETVHQRAEVRQLLADIQALPESQRTAILLREIDDLSYEQIAMAMDTTVAAVKSLLVRARMGLAEAAESRRLSCDEVRLELGQHAEGLIAKLTPGARRHMKDCESCAGFQQDLKDTNRTLAALAPAAGILLVLKGILGPLTGASQAGTGAAAGGAAAATGGTFTTIGGAVATKAAAGLAAAVAVTGAAVEVNRVTSPNPPAAQTRAASTPLLPSGGATLPAATTPERPRRERADRPERTSADAADATTPTTPAPAASPASAQPPAGSTPSAPVVDSREDTSTLPTVDSRTDTSSLPSRTTPPTTTPAPTTTPQPPAVQPSTAPPPTTDAAPPTTTP